MQRSRGGAVALALLASLTACTSAAAKSGDTGASSAQGTLVPVSHGTVVTLHGSPSTAFPAVSRGSVTVVNLWAQWCPPCRTEAPVLTSAQRLLRRSGVRFVGVETEDKASLAEKFARAHSWTWPEVDDENGQTLHDAGLASLPDTLVLDRSGRLIGELRGPVTSASGFARAVRRLAG